MAYRCFALLHLWAVARSASSAGLTKLPPDIAAQASKAAFNYAWMATNDRMGPQGHVAKDRLAAEEAIDEMKKLGEGLLTDFVVEEFRWLAFNAGWCAANRRYGDATGNEGYLDDANDDEKRMNEHYNNLVGSGLFDESLVTNLKWMAWRASWHAANDRDKRFPDDAETDKTYYDHYSKIIQGEVQLLSVDFDENAGKIAGQKPSAVASQILDNSESSIQQSMTFSFSHTQGHTDSWSNTVGFKIGLSTTIKAGFVIAELETSLSFEASYEHSWSGESSEGVQKSYSFPLDVPPHKIYQAKAIVHEATMDVPYKLTMAIGDYQWTSSGTWHGVAVSVATYKVSDITRNGTTQAVPVTSTLEL